MPLVNSLGAILTLLCLEATLAEGRSDSRKFNEYFICVGKDLAKKISKVSGSCCDYIEGNRSITVLLNPVNKAEILHVICGLQPNKVAGGHDFSTRVIKGAADITAKTPTSVFNMSISTGVFPEQLKIAKVTPSLKQMTNYFK